MDATGAPALQKAEATAFDVRHLGARRHGLTV
jgi:hypothetical protein